MCVWVCCAGHVCAFRHGVSMDFLFAHEGPVHCAAFSIVPFNSGKYDMCVFHSVSVSLLLGVRILLGLHCEG